MVLKICEFTDTEQETGVDEHDQEGGEIAKKLHPGFITIGVGFRMLLVFVSNIGLFRKILEILILGNL